METSDSLNIEIKNTWYISVLEYVFIISLFLSVNSIYWTNTNTFFRHLILLTILGSGSLLSLISLIRMRFFKTRIIWFLLIYFIIVIPLLIYNRNLGFASTETFVRMTIFPLCTIFYIVCDVASHNNIIRKIINVGLLLSIVSLLFWILRILGMNYNSFIQMDWGGVRDVPGLFKIQFFPQGSVTFLGISMLRNSGIFSEAPMYSFVLSVSLIANLFLDTDSKLIDYKTVIIGIAIITTTSTTGLLILIISLLLKFYLQAPTSGKVFVIAMIPLAIYIIEFVITAKIENMSGSVNIRLDDIQAGYKAWLQHPLLGNGLDNTYSIKLFMDQARLGLYGNDGISSGLMSMLARGGLIFSTLLFFLPVFSFSKKSIKNLFFSICFGIMFVVSIVDRTYLFLFIILWMYVSSFDSKQKL